jgi:hypothetical protein
MNYYADTADLKQNIYRQWLDTAVAADTSRHYTPGVCITSFYVYSFEMSDNIPVIKVSRVAESVPQEIEANSTDNPFGDDESLRRLFAEFADEDIALANEGLADYQRMLSEYDGE